MNAERGRHDERESHGAAAAPRLHGGNARARHLCAAAKSRGRLPLGLLRRRADARRIRARDDDGRDLQLGQLVRRRAGYGVRDRLWLDLHGGHPDHDDLPRARHLRQEGRASGAAHPRRHHCRYHPSPLSVGRSCGTRGIRHRDFLCRVDGRAVRRRGAALCRRHGLQLRTRIGAVRHCGRCLYIDWWISCRCTDRYLLCDCHDARHRSTVLLCA